MTKAVQVKAVKCYKFGGARFANESKCKDTVGGGGPLSKTHHIVETDQEKTSSYSMLNLSKTRSDPLYVTS